MKKVFAENLPKTGQTNTINWLKTKNHKVRFTYDDIEGWIEIVDVKRENNRTMLGIKYLDGDIFYIFTGHFMKCKIGEVLGINTRKYYYNIGDIIEVTTGKIKIKALTRSKNNNKDYIFECLECGWDNGRMNEGELKKETRMWVLY